ncbi:MAG: protein kinase, partial [Pyrinomonadaceae bacterium]
MRETRGSLAHDEGRRERGPKRRKPRALRLPARKGRRFGRPFFSCRCGWRTNGESLRDKLNREGQLTLEDALTIGRAVAGALDYAHRRNIVHRDIKPENIMLNEGAPMVMDFGIAKAVSVAGSDTLTQAGMIVGTPAYV